MRGRRVPVTGPRGSATKRAMKLTRSVVVSAVALGLLALPSIASAAKNPYTAAGVCGAGYHVIDRHRMFATDPSNGRQILLATVVLTYSPATGNNCAVTMKRYRVGQAVPTFGDFLSVSLAARPLGPDTARGNSGELKYFAGPVYVPARHHCVQWSGSATLLMQKNFTPRGY